MLPMTLKLTDKVKIEGESLMKGYEKQIDINYLQHGLNMPMATDKSSHSRTSGRCKHDEFICVTQLDKSYPKLLEACAKGSNLGSAELSMLKISEGKVSEVTKYTLTDTYISGVRLLPDTEIHGFEANAVARDSSLPWVEFQMNYQSIAVTYNEFDISGASKGAVSCDAITGLGA